MPERMASASHILYLAVETAPGLYASGSGPPDHVVLHFVAAYGPGEATLRADPARRRPRRSPRRARASAARVGGEPGTDGRDRRRQPRHREPLRHRARA